MTDLVPVTRVIIDDKARLKRALETTHANGRLLSDPEGIRAMRTADGLWRVTVRMMEPAPAPTRRDRLATFDRRHPILGPCLKALAFGVTVLGLVAGALFGVGFLIVKTVDLRAVGGGLLAAAILLAVVALLARPSGDGHHRKGYGYHWSKCK